jgi:hypothetical protein
MDKRIHIPSIYTSQEFEKLLGIFYPLIDDPMLKRVILDFSQCKFVNFLLIMRLPFSVA